MLYVLCARFTVKMLAWAYAQFNSWFCEVMFKDKVNITMIYVYVIL